MYISSKQFRNLELENFKQLFKKINNPELLIIELLETKETDSFVKTKMKLASELGIMVHHVKILDEEESDALFTVGELIHEYDCPVVIQLPIPKNYDRQKFTALIPERFDVDLLHEIHYEKWIMGDSKYFPPILYAVHHMMNDCMNIPDINTKEVLVIGKGDLVGRPIIDFLRNEGISFKSISAETHFDKRMEMIEAADIIITGAGSPHFLTGNLIKKGAYIVDCGTSEQAGVMVGDVHPNCESVASMISKTPGGVGPLCVFGLFENLLSYYGVKR